MDPYMPMSNNLSWLPWVRLLMMLRGPNPQQNIDDALRLVAPPFSSSTYRDATPIRPAFYYARLNNVCFLLIDGATQLVQAGGLTAGYLGRIGGVVRNPQNEYLNDAATDIVAILQDAGNGPPINLRVAGYSLGGAIAPLIPFEVQRSGWGDDRGNIITFGAPKTHGFRPNAVLGVSDRLVRVMNDNDPVPLFCPSVLDYPALLTVVDPIHAARLSNFQHVCSGYLLSPTGQITPGFSPSGSHATFAVNLAAWLFEIEQLGGNQHSLADYHNRLQQMELANDHAVHVPRAERPENEIVERREMNDVERRVVDVIAHTGAVQGHDPVVLPRDKIFRWVRVGRINCVAFGDKLITITNTKKRAIRLANSGNDFLRVLQRQAVVDPIGITSQFGAYFEFAAEVGTGFRPVLNTVMPAIGN